MQYLYQILAKYNFKYNNSDYFRPLDTYINKESIELNMKKALNDKNCMGFNTLGFFKNKIENLTPSQYFSKGDGIYIKIRNM